MPTQLVDYGAAIFGMGLMAHVLKEVIFRMIQAFGGEAKRKEACDSNDNQLTLQALQNNTQALHSLDEAIREQSRVLTRNTETLSSLRVDVAKIGPSR